MTPSWLPWIFVAAGMGLGLAVGLAVGRRRRMPADPRLQARLQDLERARDAAELANLELRDALEQMELAAGTDRLTGAWNRRRFEEAVGGEMALARRRREPVSVILMDLDHFKRVNDTHGHPVGDAVLQALVRCVQGHLRASDRLVRWGGEEFLILAPATRLVGAAALADKVRRAVEEAAFPVAGPQTVSLGVAEFLPGESLEAWVDRADGALYRAKAGGRNRVELGGTLEGEDAATHPLIELLWEEAYASGLPVIDAQHQRLFLLANALLAATTSDAGQAEVVLRLKSLLAHTAQHFHDEESLLAQAGYPDLAEHAAEHQRLLKRARGFQADVEGGRLDQGALVAFLAFDLVRGHLLSEDRNYFAHVKGEGEA